MHANKREEIASVGAGQIVAVMGLKDTKTGHTLCDPAAPGRPGVDDVPGPGDLGRDRAQDQGRPGEARHRDPAALRRGPDLHGQVRRGDRPDDHRRHGRAPPRDPRRPDASRVPRRGDRRQAAGGLPRDDPQQGRRTTSTPTRSRPVGPASSRRSTSRLEPNIDPETGQGAGYEFVNNVTRRPRAARVHPVGGPGRPGGHGVRRARRLPDGRRQVHPRGRWLPRGRLLRARLQAGQHPGLQGGRADGEAGRSSSRCSRSR